MFPGSAGLGRKRQRQESRRLSPPAGPGGLAPSGDSGDSESSLDSSAEELPAEVDGSGSEEEEDGGEMGGEADRQEAVYAKAEYVSSITCIYAQHA